MKAIEQMASLLRLTAMTIRSLLENEPPEAHAAILSAAASVETAAKTLENYVVQNPSAAREDVPPSKYRN